jgi:hypothetical protein
MVNLVSLVLDYLVDQEDGIRQLILRVEKSILTTVTESYLQGVSIRRMEKEYWTTGNRYILMEQ